MRKKFQAKTTRGLRNANQGEGLSILENVLRPGKIISHCQRKNIFCLANIQTNISLKKKNIQTNMPKTQTYKKHFPKKLLH